MKNIFTILTLLIVSSTTFADSVSYSADQEHKLVTLATLQPGQTLSIDPQFTPFISNELILTIDGKKVYSFSIDGSNYYNRHFLLNTKQNLEHDLEVLSSKCGENPIYIVGKVIGWYTSLFHHHTQLVIHPPSVGAICSVP